MKMTSAIVMKSHRVATQALFLISVVTLAVWSLILPPQSAAQAQEMAFSRAAENAARQLADAFPVLQGSVVGVEGDRVLIDLGARQKVYQGMELQVYRVGEEVKHPVTGQMLGRRDKQLGLVRVAEVKEGFSEAVLVSRHEGATITVGDLIRVSYDRLSIALPLINPGEVKGPNLHSVTKDLAIALSKTGRFIVIEDHLIKAALMEGKVPQFESFTDPAVLKMLAERTRAHLLVLGKLSPADQGVLLNLQVVSVSTGSPLMVAGVEVAGPQPRIAATSSPSPSASSTLAKNAPEFVRVPASTTSDQPKSIVREVAPAPRHVVAGKDQASPGTPSFLVKGEDARGQSGDQAARDHVTFELKEALLAVAAGDLDGDRRPEVVGMTASEVIVYRWKDRRLEPIARTEPGESFVRNLHVDVGDVNGGGQVQIVVTALSSVPEGLKLRNALRSFVLELRGDKLVRIADRMDYFLRVLTGPGIETPMLIGQRMGEKTPFTGPIVRLAWSGERYIEEQPLTLPGQVKSLYDFAPLEAAGNQVIEVAVITEQGRVRTYGRGGEPLWEGKDDLGEVDHVAFFQTPELQALRFKHGIRSGIPANPEEYADRAVLPRRLLVTSSPLWGDAKAELLTLANSTKYGVQVALGGEPPLSGRVVAYDRHDGTFARGWETIPVEGKVRDVAVVDLNGAGRRELIVLSAVKEKGFVASMKDQARGIINVFSFAK